MTAEQLILAALADGLRRRRRARNLTQQQVADKAKVSVTTVNLIENGSDARLSTYAKVAAALEITFTPKSA